MRTGQPWFRQQDHDATTRRSVGPKTGKDCQPEDSLEAELDCSWPLDQSKALFSRHRALQTRMSWWASIAASFGMRQLESKGHLTGRLQVRDASKQELGPRARHACLNSDAVEHPRCRRVDTHTHACVTISRYLVSFQIHRIATIAIHYAVHVASSPADEHGDPMRK